MTKKDDIYAQPIQSINDFKFDEHVAGVFSDMINRSVPGYTTIIGMSGVLAGKFAQANSRCYDLGCSLGATTLAMRENIEQADCEIIAIDNSAAMIARFQETLAKLPPSKHKVTIRQDDILNVEIVGASVVAMNFTLQFIAKEQRAMLLKRIYQGLKPGGILILSEKLHFDDQQLDELFIEMHHEFKRHNGYSALEISQKRTALENVLLPESLATHKTRLNSAGFSCVDVWFQCFNFASMVALK
jgi:tRNA (cmo5U34)-methyltransferase